MEPVDLSNSPDLTMEEITKQLFNNDFLSDITFNVEGKVMYAHSWELMKRSLVFREQFRPNLGVNKFIPIDATYKVFYQFLRFIYTDKCDIEQGMISEMLKLAVKYKIVKLETKVLNMDSNSDTDLKLFEYSLLNEYELGINLLFDYLVRTLDTVIQMDNFFNVHYKVVEKILKNDRMRNVITELKLFEALVGWMNKACATNQIPLPQRRVLFDRLLRLIRFPIMTTNEFRLCARNNPGLFTNEDISIICQQITLGSQSENQRWISQPRLEYIEPFKSFSCRTNNKLETKFTVSTNLILHGLRFGSGKDNYEVFISGKNRATKVTDIVSFKFVKTASSVNTISLGESIKLKPNVEYTIVVKFKTDEQHMVVNYRKPITPLIVTGPSHFVTFQKTSDNLFEIFFKLQVD